MAHDSEAVESHILEMGEHPLAAMPLLRYVGWVSLFCESLHVPSDLLNNIVFVRCHCAQPFLFCSIVVPPTVVDLATLTAATSPPTHNSTDVPRLFARGRMRISKGRDTAAQANDVDVLLVVIRLASVSSDVLLTFNRPTAFAAESQSQGCRVASVDEHEAVVQRFLTSFQIVSMDIFG